MDNGEGISPEILNQMEDSEKWRLSKKESTGYGILIARRIVRQHKGKGPHFQGVDGGCDYSTKVTIRLPLATQLPKHEIPLQEKEFEGC